jgi:hypothetical protein
MFFLPLALGEKPGAAVTQYSAIFSTAILCNIPKLFLPSHHHLQLFAALLELLHLISRLRDGTLIVELVVGFPGIAGYACREQIRELIRTACRDRSNVIDVEDNVWCECSAILTLERIALKNFEANSFRDSNATVRFGFHESNM